MRYSPFFRYTFLFILAINLASCKFQDIFPKKDTTTDTTTDTSNPNAAVNKWIYDEMKTYYLWTGQMPSASATDATLAPDAYFESLLYQSGTTDRFSWIQESSTELVNSLNGKNTVLGIRSTPFYMDEGKVNVAFAIVYVLKGSPAEKAGLKRGDFITKVDGVQITVDNYQTAFANETMTLTLGTYENSTIVSNLKTVTVTKAEVQTDPILYYNIIETGGKKIGYLVYLQFLSQYDNSLRTLFQEFKAKGVDELVLDLRYNGGGYISSAVTLSSLIGKGVNNTKVMYRDEWNQEQTDYYTKKYGANYFTKNFTTEANNPGTLSRLYVLTSKGTASASELVINSLKPYMDVILVGDNTYGKNVGSITISDDQNRWDWGMQPIVLKTYNSSNESNYGTKDGFTPTIRVSDNVLPYKPLGDVTETLLSAAIADITGQTVASVRGARSIDKEQDRVSNMYLSDNPKLDRKDMWAEPLK